MPKSEKQGTLLKKEAFKNCGLFAMILLVANETDRN
jgi:hypothetical protein